MNKTMTVDEARDVLINATGRYREVEAAIAETVAGESSPERVLRHLELQAALSDAATQLISAKATFDQVQAESAKRQRERASIQLEEVERELAVAIVDVEEEVERLAQSMKRVLDLSKRRYAYRHEATGRASRSLLARAAAYGWLMWRLQGLELPDLSTAPHHYRAPLAELLGLNTETQPAPDPGAEQ